MDRYDIEHLLDLVAIAGQRQMSAAEHGRLVERVDQIIHAYDEARRRADGCDRTETP